MKAGELMSQPVHKCSPEDTLEHAARAMWEADVGCLPVVDEEGRPVGVLTDRDVCMAAYTQGVALRDSRVSSAMSHSVISCSPESSIAHRADAMRNPACPSSTDRFFGRHGHLADISPARSSALHAPAAQGLAKTFAFDHRAPRGRVRRRGVITGAQPRAAGPVLMARGLHALTGANPASITLAACHRPNPSKPRSRAQTTAFESRRRIARRGRGTTPSSKKGFPSRAVDLVPGEEINVNRVPERCAQTLRCDSRRAHAARRKLVISASGRGKHTPPSHGQVSWSIQSTAMVSRRPMALHIFHENAIVGARLDDLAPGRLLSRRSEAEGPQRAACS
jgi:hypothetical protein